jgi:beta-phosphoglucomutase-like phosphatase (HAD superfamily)
LPARDCLCFEDSQNGLRAALGAGLPTIVTPSLYSAGEDFSGVALVIETLEAFWRRPEFHTDQGQRERRAAGG